MTSSRTPGRKVKCVVWDLDNTLWSGILLEGDDVQPDPVLVAVIKALDSRGIVHSIASRNDPEAARTKLEELGLTDLFLVPQISWSTKSSAIRRISELLNLGTDAIAFVDDDPAERSEVASSLPEVLCVPTERASALPEMPEFVPEFVTSDSRLRRDRYRAEEQRRALSEEMPAATFLASLDLVLTITSARADDLERIHELTLRTNQLNSTGETFSFDELAVLRKDPQHLMLIAELEDRFGSYGKIGFALVDTRRPEWMLRTILMSCRVMSRGVGAPFLNEVARRAQREHETLQARFVRTERNRFMYLTFKLSGFEEIEREHDVAILERDPAIPIPDSDYLTVHTEQNRRDGHP